MAKKIAIFSDGTGNSSAKLQKTNVWRMYKALDLSTAANQVAFYDDGVGTSSVRPLAILGGAFGFGLARNVREIYRFVCRTYQPGDEIYGFGFSRGAFTMRVVVAFIAHQGIIDIRKTGGERDLNRLTRAAYRKFRRESFSNAGLAVVLRPVRDVLIRIKDRIAGCTPYKPEANLEYPGNAKASPHLVSFLGVWDTVDAYGLPIDEMTRAYDRMVWPLSAKDRGLSPRVRRACHALALDEQRESFEPMLWNEDGESVSQDGGNISDERLTQIWFAGVHSNVGGGYADDALSYLPLNWILEESARNNGLKFLPRELCRLKDGVNLNGRAYDSRRGIGTFYRYLPRHLEKLCNEERPGLANWIKSWFVTGLNMNEVKIDRPKVHHTVLERLQTGADAYAPINLPADYAVVQPDGRILVTKNSRGGDNGEIILADGSILKSDGSIYPKSGPPITCRVQDPDGNTLDARYILPEHEAAARERRRAQELLWNKVWLRRMVYRLTLLATAVFLAFPFLGRGLLRSTQAGAGITAVNDRFDSLFGTWSSVIRSIPQTVGELPGLGFAENFFAQYIAYPYLFCVLLVIIGLLITWSGRLKVAINDGMRANWSHIARTSDIPRAPAGEFARSLAGIRNRPFYERGLARPVRLFTELLALFFFAYVVIAVVSRVSLVVLDGTGLICPASDPQKRLSPNAEGDEFDFYSNASCLAAAVGEGEKRHYLMLDRGEYYWIEMKLGEGWSDAGIRSDIFGWEKAPAYQSLFLPFRRHLAVDWYRPVVRIDNQLFDRYPLLAGRPPPPDEERGETCLRRKVRARNTGQLYLYLNDAVLFSPNIGLDRLTFYTNNHGDARVRVSLTDADSDAPKAPLCEIGSKQVSGTKP